MKKMIPFLAGLSLLFVVACQSDKKKSSIKEKTLPSTEQADSSAHNKSRQDEIRRVQRQKPGPYNGWGNIIKSFTKTGNIPKDLPKYSGEGAKAYKKKLIEYGIAHKDLIKPAQLQNFMKLKKKSAQSQ